MQKTFNKWHREAKYYLKWKKYRINMQLLKQKIQAQKN